MTEEEIRADERKRIGKCLNASLAMCALYRRLSIIERAIEKLVGGEPID